MEAGLNHHFLKRIQLLTENRNNPVAINKEIQRLGGITVRVAAMDAAEFERGGRRW